MTGKRPQTTQFRLPQCEPQAIRFADTAMLIVQAVLVPRSKLPEAAKRNELKSVGVYFLFGEPEDAAKPVVYIGETEDCYDRFLQHNRTLDFWQTAVAIVSKTNSFTKAHAKYLEWHCIKVAKEVGRFHLSNGQAGYWRNRLAMAETLIDAFQTGQIIEATPAVRQLLVRLADDPKWEVRKVIANGLNLIEDAVFDDLSTRLLNDANGFVRRSAEQSYGMRRRDHRRNRKRDAVDRQLASGCPNCATGTAPTRSRT